jgi:hypothetical protein
VRSLVCFLGASTYERLFASLTRLPSRDTQGSLVATTVTTSRCPLPSARAARLCEGERSPKHSRAPCLWLGHSWCVEFPLFRCCP